MSGSTNSIWVMIAVTLTLILCGLLQAEGSVSISQGKRKAADEESKDLIVMIRSRLADADIFGAGIIFGVANNRLYIATANHVVRQGKEEAQDIQVQIRFLPGETVKASLLRNSDPAPGLDLAVLVVDYSSYGIPINELRFDHLGDPSSLRRGDALYSIGNLHGQPWRVNVTPDRVSAKSGNSISFESASIGSGHSGGGLLNERWELVGMIKETEPPDGSAVSIKSIVQTLTEWGYPVNLSPAPQTQPDKTVGLSKQREAVEKTVSDFIAAWVSGDVETIIKLSTTPFYFDQEILLRTSDIRERYEKLRLEKGKGWKEVIIKSLKTRTIAELKQEGYDTRRDRVLSNMDMRDDDFAVQVRVASDLAGTQTEGALYFVRITEEGPRVVALWD